MKNEHRHSMVRIPGSSLGPPAVKKARLGDDLVNGKRVRCYALPESAGFDRWVAVYPDREYSNDGMVECVGMSGHSGAVLGRHLGRRVKLAELPESLQRTVQADCAD